tara:strand:+ start:157 stop:423 length:267 start_codon:yes stop_codon:yes gene_type:complete
MLRRTCKCSHAGKNIKPIPRFPKEVKIDTRKKDTLNTTSDVIKIEKKIEKMNRYRYILTRMPDPIVQYTKTSKKKLGGFLPEISFKNK